MIIVIVRVLNEEHRIEKFCQAYKDADKILVADGGSEDKTIEIAQTFLNVEVRSFDKRVELANGHWRNPDGEHTNFLIAWAKEYSPDFIISDDCDCLPNFNLRRDYQKILEETDKDFIFVTRIYFWGLDKHFPQMAQPGTPGVWEPSLYAWRGHLDFWTVDAFPHFTFQLNGQPVHNLHFDANTLDLFPPYALLHYSWDNEERVNKKLEHHRNGLGIPMRHPLEMGGPLAELEDWMTK